MDTINVKYNCHLTENHQLQAADTLIKKLKFKLGEAESYIQELEDEQAPKIKEIKEKNAKLNEENQKLKSELKQALKLSDGYKQVVDKITARYSEDLTVLKETSVIAELNKKHQDEVDKLQKDLELALKQRDAAITQLLKLNEEKRIS